MEAITLLKHGRKPGLTMRDKAKMKEKFKDFKQAWKEGHLWPTKK